MQRSTLYRRVPVLVAIFLGGMLASAGCTDDEAPVADPAESIGPNSSPVSAEPSTVPFDRERAGDAASAMLLDSAEYSEGWVPSASSAQALDRSVAEQVSGCAPFLDSVFESPDRAAVTASRTFYWYPPATAGQYVVLFASEEDASAMFEALMEPSFGARCLQPYDASTHPSGQCCDPSEPPTPPLFGESVPAAIVDGADDVDVRVQDGAYWLDPDGARHGPEQRRSVILRVGPAVIAMDSVLARAPGEPLMSIDQFDEAIANAVGRARTALEPL